ncbi:MAG TPA: DUF1501 domain-containing protein [Gemmataceae bacterium]|jgi:hypothetical protein
MLTVWGGKQRYCDGLSRRTFLKIGALGAGLTLADMLRLRADASTDTNRAPKSVIMVYLGGGPSHIDTYDLKPDAPVEYRGEFRPIATNVPGIRICELLPLQARIMDKLAIIRSLIGTGEHSDSAVTTGYPQAVNRTAHHPSIGAVISKLRGTGEAGIPPFVSLPTQNGTLLEAPGDYPGYLGIAHRPFTPQGPGLQNLRWPVGVDRERMHERRTLLQGLDSLRRDLDTSGVMEGLDSYSARAFDMVTSGTVRKALDLSREDPRVIDRYDANNRDFFQQGGDKFLLARRLVEAGVACVTVGFGGYDTHASNFKTLRSKLPIIDRGLANLIQDLHDRGMDKDVVTILWGEFGRTPKVGDAAPDGRGHWPPVMSALIAGGGLKMGQVIGSTNARAETPKDRPYRVPQVLSTIYQVIGIDPAKTFPNGSGRPMYILDDRDPVEELL